MLWKRAIFKEALQYLQTMESSFCISCIVGFSPAFLLCSHYTLFFAISTSSSLIMSMMILSFFILVRTVGGSNHVLLLSCVIVPICWSFLLWLCSPWKGTCFSQVWDFDLENNSMCRLDVCIKWCWALLHENLEEPLVLTEVCN